METALIAGEIIISLRQFLLCIRNAAESTEYQQRVGELVTLLKQLNSSLQNDERVILIIDCVKEAMLKAKAYRKGVPKFSLLDALSKEVDAAIALLTSLRTECGGTTIDEQPQQQQKQQQQPLKWSQTTSPRKNSASPTTVKPWKETTEPRKPEVPDTWEAMQSQGILYNDKGERATNLYDPVSSPTGGGGGGGVRAAAAAPKPKYVADTSKDNEFESIEQMLGGGPSTQWSDVAELQRKSAPAVGRNPSRAAKKSVPQEQLRSSQHREETSPAVPESTTAISAKYAPSPTKGAVKSPPTAEYRFQSPKAAGPNALSLNRFKGEATSKTK